MNFVVIRKQAISRYYCNMKNSDTNHTRIRKANFGYVVIINDNYAIYSETPTFTIIPDELKDINLVYIDDIGNRYNDLNIKSKKGISRTVKFKMRSDKDIKDSMPFDKKLIIE